MSVLLQDLKHSIRQLWQRPIFAVSVVLTLAVGIGVNTVAFTVVNGVLFNRAAMGIPDDMGRILTLPGGDEGGNASLPEYQRFAEATRGALDLAAEGRLSVAWRHESVTETAYVLFVSPTYFSIVGVPPIAGRSDVARGAGDLPTCVIGERFWRRKLNAAPIAGLTLLLNGISVSVVGVLPDSYTGPAGLYSPDVWLPLDDVARFKTSPALQNRDERWLFLLGRMKPGVGVPEIQGRIDAVVAGMTQDWPDTHARRSARFRLRNEGNSELRGLTTAAAVAMGIIGLVLLLACFNVANLLLARAVERERDIGIRAAMGARPMRLVRLVLTEGFVIAMLAGAVALVLASWTQSLVGSFAIPIEQPQHIELTPDWTVVAFTLVLVLIAGTLPGLWPALAAARVDVLRVLRAQGGNSVGGRPSRLGRWLVGAQIAGSTAFLVVAALFAQSYARLSVVDLGFDRDRLVVADFAPASHGYDAARTERYVEALLARVRALPGVTDVAIADRAPFFIGFDRPTAISSTGAPCVPDACATAPTMAVGPGYFRTMGIGLAAGREFQTGAAAEVIINQPLARQYFPAGGGVGETLRIGDRGVPVSVIGITARTHTRGLDRERPTLYVPLGRANLGGALSLVARTAASPEGLVRPFLDAAQALDQNVSMLSVKPMEQRLAVQLWPFRTVSWLFSICGGLALVLATTGLTGVVIHAVNRRIREFGVRVSIGATPRDLVLDVLGGSARLLLPGLVVGILLAAAGARLVQAAFVGVNVLNPVTYVAVALLECAIVVIACIAPALRAARVDPLVALRSS
ncbi:MAG TPA: ADOP family duplicated permease [Vicinamibacterales bacterium]|nr:ADOP family duplicated permease [Vicinamibacterales bacterium]